MHVPRVIPWLFAVALLVATSAMGKADVAPPASDAPAVGVQPVAPEPEAAPAQQRDATTGRPRLVGKPSGFWTSPVPAKGGAYRYRMLGIGVALLLGTGLLTLSILRRHGVRVPDAERPYAKPPAR